MAEADLWPTTFTSRSASDPDYDISTEDSSGNENENTYTEASSDNSSSDPETESNAKTEVRRSSTMPKTKPKPIWTGSSCHPLELIKLLKQFTRNGSLVVFSCFRKSKKATGIEHRLREELLLSPRTGFENYPSRKTFATHFIWYCDSHSSTFSDLTNQWLLWKLCYALRKEIEIKRTKKRLSL